MRPAFTFPIMLCFCLGCLGSEVRVGLITDNAWQRFTHFRTQLSDEFQVLSNGEITLSFSETVEDLNQAHLSRQLDRLLVDDAVDVVVGIGPQVADLLRLREELNKPALVVVPQLEPDLSPVPPRPNLLEITLSLSLTKHVEMLSSFAHSRQVVILTDRPLPDGMMPPLSAVESARGCSLRVMPVTDVLATADALPLGTDGVVLAPLLSWSDESVAQFAKILGERGIASVSMVGRHDVALGISLGLHVEMIAKLARRLAMDLNRILMQSSHDTEPGLFVPRQQPSINLETAHRLDISPSWDVLLTYETLARNPPDVSYSLDEIIQEGLSANLALRGKKDEVAIAEQDLAAARAIFRPQVDFTTTGRSLDEERSNFLNPEQTLVSQVSVSQLLFSEGGRARRDFQISALEGRQHEVQQAKLETTAALIQAYLAVVASETNLEILRSNLDLTRAHLDFARMRGSVGVSDDGDTYRWESRLAADTQQLIDARASHQAAGFKLNQLLNRPTEAELGLEVPDLTTFWQSTGLVRLTRMLDTPKGLRLFLRFLSQESKRDAPLLKAMQARLAASERRLDATARAFYLPDVSMGMSYGSRLYEGGAGGSSNEFPVPGFNGDTDTGWSLGVKLSFAAYRGGAKRSEHTKAGLEFSKLQRDYVALEAAIEQEIFSAGHIAAGSFARIEQAKNGREAAEKNYALINEGYRAGRYSLLQVLDAQNNAVTARQNQAHLIFRFLGDLTRLELAVGKFQLMTSKGQVDELLERFGAYWEQAQPPRPAVERMAIGAFK